MKKSNKVFTATLLAIFLSGCAHYVNTPSQFYSGTKYSTQDLGCYSFGSSWGWAKNIAFASVLGSTTDSLATNTANAMKILNNKSRKIDSGAICELTLEQAMEIGALVSHNTQKSGSAEHRSYDHFISHFKDRELNKEEYNEPGCGLYVSNAISRINGSEYKKGYVICDADGGGKARYVMAYDPIEKVFDPE